LDPGKDMFLEVAPEFDTKKYNHTVKAMLVDLIYISNTKYKNLITSSNNGDIRFWRQSGG